MTHTVFSPAINLDAKHVKVINQPIVSSTKNSFKTQDNNKSQKVILTYKELQCQFCPLKYMDLNMKRLCTRTNGH